MSHFEIPLVDYMSKPLVQISQDQNLESALALLDSRGLTALPVCDKKGELAGVISRTDLLRAMNLCSNNTLKLPDQPIRQLMTRGVIGLEAEQTLSNAARLMVKERVHRVFVLSNGDPVGVVSTRDLMRAVCDTDIRTPIDAIATKKLIKVRTSDSISLASARLDVSNKSGLVVTFEKWPVGVFSQIDALNARGHEQEEPVEKAMDMRVLAVPGSLPLSRATEQALSMGARRILIVGDGVEGIVSGLDYARVVAAK